MRVRVGNTIYDSEEEPVQLIFENEAERDKIVDLLSWMGSQMTMCIYPKGMNSDLVRTQMESGPVRIAEERFWKFSFLKMRKRPARIYTVQVGEKLDVFWRWDD